MLPLPCRSTARLWTSLYLRYTSPSADEVDAQRKEAIKAKVGELPRRKWVDMKGETRDDARASGK